MENPKKRRPVVALLLSFITPGLGQLYNGQVKRAGFLYLSGLLLIFIFFSGFYSKFYFLILFLALGVCYFLFAMADALHQVIRIKAISLKMYNRWYLYLLIVLVHFFLIGFSVYMNLFPVKLYRIPSASMAPTLLPGDYFYIDKKYYRDKKPKRGEIVVFQSPVDASKDFIKRVVGLPCETIGLTHRDVFINKKLLEEPYRHHVVTEYSSSMLNSKIILGPVKVPKDKIFVIGDNREGSNDSRHYGPVKLSSLKGKALHIVWAKGKGRIGKEIK